MGITVLSAPVASASMTASATTPSAAPTLAADGIPIDFAALLTGQIAGLPLAASKVADSSPVKDLKEDTDKSGDLIRDLLLAQDSAQTAQNVIANIPPALENRLQIDVDRNNLASMNTQSSLALVVDAQKGVRGSATATTALSELAANPGNPVENTAPFVANIASGLQNNLPASIKDDTKTTSSIQADTPSQIKPAANPNQASLQSLSEIAQTASMVTANLAAETNTGNTTPSTFASMLAGHSAQSQPAQHAAATGNPTVTTPLQDNRWAQDFSERIVWVAKNDQQVAQINISPAQLGPVQITLNMNGDQASIAFASPHAEVRKAIEDAMPNLREMLSTAGISLGQSNVGAQLQQQQRDTNPQFANGNRSAGETAILPADSRSGSLSTGLPIQRGRGLVDLFA